MEPTVQINVGSRGKYKLLNMWDRITHTTSVLAAIVSYIYEYIIIICNLFYKGKNGKNYCNLFYSIHYPNSGMESIFHSAPFRSIPFHSVHLNSAPFRSLPSIQTEPQDFFFFLNSLTTYKLGSSWNIEPGYSQSRWL